MATPPVSVTILHPAAGAAATVLPLSIANVWAANVSVPPAPTAGVILGNGQPVLPGAGTSASSGILFFMTAADQLFYKREESTSVTSATSVSTAVPPASASSSQPQATTGTNINTEIPSAPTGNSTAPASSHSAKSSANSGLQPGAAAGLAIGCLLAGIIIAGALFWFLCGKRRRSRSQYSGGNSLPLVAQEKGFSNQTTALHSKGSATTPLISSLPQPLEDKAISGDISKISNSIKNHVQSYYHTSRVNPALIDHDDLQALGPKIPIAIGTLSTLLANAATREIALRFCIAWAVISRMQESSTQSNGLLPAEIAGCLGQIMAQSNSTSRAAQTSQWRTMTAELMHSTYVRNPFSPSDSRNTSIQGILRALDNVLQPYADSRMDNEQRKHNLEEVIKRSALFAFTLFSQPSLWEFDWKEEQGVKSGELCIFPALVQIADENGEAVRPPRPFSEAVVRRLD